MQVKQLKVLLVEDNPGDARLVQEMLADAEAFSFQITCADTLLGALDALANRTFDVALVDLRFARSLYRWIVIDMGRLDAVGMHLLQEMRDLYVISTDEVPSLYEANRVLKRLIDLGFKRDQVRLMLNRIPKSAAGSVNDLEKAMGYLFYGVVSDHSKELREAHASGRALHEGLNIHRDVVKLVAKSLGIEAKPAPATGLNLFRFGRSQPQPQ